MKSVRFEGRGEQCAWALPGVTLKEHNALERGVNALRAQACSEAIEKVGAAARFLERPERGGENLCVVEGTIGPGTPLDVRAVPA